MPQECASWCVAKPRLVLGLGNPLMGDDGAGARVAEMLAADSAVTDRAEVFAAGTDLLRSMERIDGRERVILVDAVECGDEPGRISVRSEERRVGHEWRSHGAH